MSMTEIRCQEGNVDVHNLNRLSKNKKTTRKKPQLFQLNETLCVFDTFLNSDATEFG